MNPSEHLQAVFRVWCQHAVHLNGGDDWLLAANLVMFSVGWTLVQMQALPPSLGHYSGGEGGCCRGLCTCCSTRETLSPSLPSLRLSEEWGQWHRVSCGRRENVEQLLELALFSQTQLANAAPCADLLPAWMGGVHEEYS